VRAHRNVLCLFFNGNGENPKVFQDAAEVTEISKSIRSQGVDAPLG